MGDAIGQILPTAVGVTISPLPIVAVVLMLVTARGRVNGPAFALARNSSAVTANRVVVADRLAPGTAYDSADPSQGRCFTRGTRLLICPLGDLGPGAGATIDVRVQQIDPSAGVNVAVAGASSPEDVLRNNADVARIAALRPPPATACPSSAPPIARASCWRRSGIRSRSRRPTMRRCDSGARASRTRRGRPVAAATSPASWDVTTAGHDGPCMARY